MPEFENYLEERIEALENAPQPGASVAGSPVVRAFPFTFNTPGILTGAALYTPTIGDVLLNAWISILTAWDGTTPRGDVGTFVDKSTGWWAVNLVPIGMDQADDQYTGTGVLTAYGSPGLSEAQSVANAQRALVVDNSGPSLTFGPDVAVGGARTAATFIAANPIKVVVSQNGHNDGADPGATQGSAVLYLITATPT